MNCAGKKKKNMERTDLAVWLLDQLTLVRLKHAAALFSSFSATCSVDCVVSFNDSSELQGNFFHHQFQNKKYKKNEFWVKKLIFYLES